MDHLDHIYPYLAFFGIVVDMLHTAVPLGRLSWIWGSLEDGGEMLIMSLFVCVVFDIKSLYEERILACSEVTSAS